MFLNRTCLDPWKVRRGNAECFARSPDFKSLYSFPWGYLKSDDVTKNPVIFVTSTIPQNIGDEFNSK